MQYGCLLIKVLKFLKYNVWIQMDTRCTEEERESIWFLKYNVWIQVDTKVQP